MIERHDILHDKEFWLQLEFKASGWLTTCDDPHLRGFWIDGFSPGLARNTKSGLEVEGTAWVMGRTTGEYQFITVLPQKLLHRRNPAFVIDGLSFDEGHRTLRIVLASGGPPVG